MQTLDAIQKTLTSQKAELFERFGIRNLAIFGSIDLADQLESILELRVDLVSRTGIKPKYYNAISSDLRYV